MLAVATPLSAVEALAQAMAKNDGRRRAAVGAAGLDASGNAAINGFRLNAGVDYRDSSDPGAGRKKADTLLLTSTTRSLGRSPAAAQRAVATKSGRTRGRFTDVGVAQAGTSREKILYLKFSGSRLSTRPSAVSACGYMRKPTGAPFEPGNLMSWA